MRTVAIHIGVNKRKILIILHSSKTHSVANRPQKIKIEATEPKKEGCYKFFCPFELLRHFMKLRGNFKDENEQLFIFHDKSAIKAQQARKLLKLCLHNLGLNAKLYNFHSMRIGMATSLIRNNQDFESVKRAGRWSSNAVYRYLKQ